VLTVKETVCRGRGGERTQGAMCCVDEDGKASEQQLEITLLSRGSADC
jgi:hypothetical protein